MQPMEFFTIVGSAAAVLGILITWMTRRFDKIDDELKTVAAESKAQSMDANARNDTILITMNQRTDELIKSGNARFDAMNKASNDRFDAITSRIDRMLEKQGK